MFEYANEQYVALVGGSATTLDAKLMELAPKGVAVDILIGRSSAIWTVAIDNFELYSVK